MDIIGKDKLDSIFGRFVGDAQPKWTRPSGSHSCSSSYVAPGTYNFVQLSPDMSYIFLLPCLASGLANCRKARRKEK